MLYSPKLLSYTPTLLSEGGKSWFPFFDTRFINMSTLAGTGLSLGDLFYLTSPSNANYVYNGGNAFLVVKAGAALSVGQAVTYNDSQALTVTTTSTNYRVDFTTSPLTAGAEVGNLIYINNATTQMTRIIKENATGTITVAKRDPLNPNPTVYDGDVFETVPANNDPAHLIRPFQVKVCTASFRPIGIALGTVTSGNYTLLHVGGITNALVLGAASLAIGTPLVPGAAGVMTKSSTDSPILFSEGTTCVAAAAWATASNRLVPCWINFMGAA
jgi:hypothetical protein